MMRTIRLKHKSPEFDGIDIPERYCDSPGCEHAGEFRAPKSRHNLDDYYWFCLEHVRDYNARWDYCADMTPAQITAMITAVATWDRPTRPFASLGKMDAEFIRDAVYNDFRFSDRGFYDFKSSKKHANFSGGNWEIPDIPTQELDALAIFQLEPPVTLEDIKARYKKLAKKYHPDINKGDKTSEELIKKINIAYSILKIAYNKFTELDHDPR